MARKYYFPIFITFFFLLPIISFCKLSSPSVATAQMNFWAKNVVNQMPQFISQKLSPLSIEDSNYYAHAISANPDFKADSNLCTKANLGCSGNTIYQPLGDRSYTTLHREYNPALTKKLKEIEGIAVLDDPFSFFRLSNLQPGKTIQISNFSDNSNLRSPSFLPSNVASKISLHQISRIFPDTFQGAVDISIMMCEAPAIRGEAKACLNSLEELIDYPKRQLQTKDMKRIYALSLMSLRGSGQELLIENSKKLDIKKFVSCHENGLPFATYFCHTIADSRIYYLKLVEPKTGAEVNSLYAVCHMDTSAFPADHVLFKILKTRPGESEACHWIDSHDIAWIAAN